MTNLIDPKRHGAPWTVQEEGELLEGWKQGLELDELARLHERRFDAVRGRLAKLLRTDWDQLGKNPYKKARLAHVSDVCNTIQLRVQAKRREVLQQHLKNTLQRVGELQQQLQAELQRGEELRRAIEALDGAQARPAEAVEAPPTPVIFPEG